MISFQEWGWKEFCNQKKEGSIREKIKLNLVLPCALAGIDMVTIFLSTISRDFIEKVVLLEINDSLLYLTFGEFLRWIGI